MSKQNNIKATWRLRGSDVARAAKLSARSGWGLVVAFALLWNLFSTLAVYPHQLAYFNEGAGGPRNGHKHLLGSNLDWGQDKLILRRWVREQGVEIEDYFGELDRSAFECVFATFEQQRPRRRVRVASANVVFRENPGLNVSGERIAYTLWVVRPHKLPTLDLRRRPEAERPPVSHKDQ